MRDERRDIGAPAAHFAGAERVFAGSPLYRALCGAVAGDESTLRLLRRRRAGQQPSFLLFAAVHFLLLRGAPHELRRFYPSHTGGDAEPPGRAAAAFIDFCRMHGPELTAIIATRLVQTNVVRRSVALRLAMSVIARSCAAPVHLVEVGASAGIHLHSDRSPDGFLRERRCRLRDPQPGQQRQPARPASRSRPL